MGFDEHLSDFGGLPARVVRAVAASDLPALRHLGLQNSEIQDEIAAALASAPVVAWLESLSVAAAE